MLLFNVKLITLLETGTCASGNTPFVIARQCPEGTGTDILLLGASVFAGLIGVAIFAVRGRPPRGRQGASRFPAGAAAWGLFFTATGASALIAALSSETIGPDGEAGGAIVGGTFLLMGLPVLLYVLRWPLAWTLERRRTGPANGSGSGSVRQAGPTSIASLPTHAGSATGAATGWVSSVQPPTRGPRAAQPFSGRPSSEPGDAIARLERLQKLRESGALTETEFQLQKNKILSE